MNFIYDSGKVAQRTNKVQTESVGDTNTVNMLQCRPDLLTTTSFAMIRAFFDRNSGNFTRI